MYAGIHVKAGDLNFFWQLDHDSQHGSAAQAHIQEQNVWNWLDPNNALTELYLKSGDYSCMLVWFTDSSLWWVTVSGQMPSTDISWKKVAI